MIRISIPEASAWRLRVTLSGKAYYMSGAWNLRDDRWYLSLETSEGAPILSGRKVLVSRNLLRRVASPQRPPGSLFAVDVSGAERHPSRHTLGREFWLVYAEPGEVL